MASRLYELLGVPKDATTEQIRRAYRKKALKTHPDKLSPDLSQEERDAAADKFREISHACEILTDPEKRREYDMHGVWPPPQPQEDAFRSSSRNGRRSHSHAYPPHEYHQPYHNYAFRDPFEFFRTMFEDMFQASPMHSPFAPFDPFDNFISHRSQSMFPGNLFSMPSIGSHSFSGFPEIRGGGSSSYSESFSSRTVNGVTETIHTVHRDGNEHVTRQYPDGTKIYTINGVEQPSSRGDHLVRDTSTPRLLTSGQSRPRRSEAPLYSQSQVPQSHREARHSNGHDSHYSRNYLTPTSPSSRRREYDITPPSYTGTNYPHGLYDMPHRSRDGAYGTGYSGSPPVYDDHLYPQTRSSRRA